MFKKVLATLALLSSVSYGVMTEISDIQDPIDTHTLICSLPYRVYGKEVSCTMHFPETLTVDNTPNSWETWKELRSTLIGEAGLVLSKVSDFRATGTHNTPENERALQQLFWNRIHLLQVWHLKFLDVVSSLATTHPDEQASNVMGNVTPLLTALNAFCERFDANDIAPFRLGKSSGWTDSTYHFHHNLKHLRMLQAFLNMHPSGEEIVLIPDDVPLVEVTIPTPRDYTEIDVSQLAFNPFTQFSATANPIPDYGILQVLSNPLTQSFAQRAHTYSESDSLELLPKKLDFIQTFVNFCLAILDELVPIEHPGASTPVLHQLFWDNFHFLDTVLADTITHGHLQESTREELHRIYSRLVYFTQIVNLDSFEYFQRPDNEQPLRILNSSLEGRSNLYPNERFTFLFRSIFD